MVGIPYSNVCNVLSTCYLFLRILSYSLEFLRMKIGHRLSVSFRCQTLGQGQGLLPLGIESQRGPVSVSHEAYHTPDTDVEHFSSLNSEMFSHIKQCL